MDDPAFSDFLRGVPAFAGFDAEELLALARALALDEHPDGYRFMTEGQPGEGLYLVVRGEVEATHPSRGPGGLPLVERLGPGDLFGLVSLIDHAPQWATCVARGPVTVATLPRNAFDLLYTAQAPIARHFQALIAGQLARDVRACVAGLSAGCQLPG